MCGSFRRSVSGAILLAVGVPNSRSCSCRVAPNEHLIQKNRGKRVKDPSAFKGRLNAQYLNAFLSMKYSESTKLDEGKCNGLRSMLGLPLQGTIKTQCDMFCNRYPLEDALKLFGAMDGKGAQAIK